MTTSTFAAITGDFSAQLAPEHQSVATLLERIFVLMKIIGSHGTTHPSTHEMATAALSALRQCRLPGALQFVREAVFYDRTLVPLDVEGFKRGQSLSLAMNHCGVHEISFESGVDETALIAFFEVLSKGLVGPNDQLEHMRLTGISWREIPGAGWGAEAKPIDPDLFAVTQVSLAVADTDLLADAFGQPWNWAAGVSILRRLERAVEVDARAADRAVELVCWRWSASWVPSPPRHAPRATLRLCLAAAAFAWRRAAHSRRRPPRPLRGWCRPRWPRFRVPSAIACVSAPSSRRSLRRWRPVSSARAPLRCSISCTSSSGGAMRSRAASLSRWPICWVR
jgi:hypothetical protein